MREPKGWRLSRAQLLSLLNHAGQRPENYRALTENELLQLARKFGLALEHIMLLVASNDELSKARSAKGTSSLFELAAVHPTVDKYLCQDSVFWRAAWEAALKKLKACDVREHKRSGLSARDKLRLLSYAGCQCCRAQKIRKVYWPWRVRMCEPCFNQRAISITDAQRDWPEVPFGKMNGLPHFTKQMFNANYAVFGYHQPEYTIDYLFKPHLAPLVLEYAAEEDCYCLDPSWFLPATAAFRDRASIVARADEETHGSGSEVQTGSGAGAGEDSLSSAFQQADTLEGAMAQLAAQKLPQEQASVAADAILARFMPEAFAVVNAAAAGAAAAAAPTASRQSRLLYDGARTAASAAAGRAAAARWGKNAAAAAAGPVLPLKPRKTKAAVSRVVDQSSGGKAVKRLKAGRGAAAG